MVSRILLISAWRLTATGSGSKLDEYTQVQTCVELDMLRDNELLCGGREPS